MRRDLATGRPTGRVLAGHAMLLATGVGAVMSAGAGLASAAPLDDGSKVAPTGSSASPASALPVVGSPAHGGTATAAESPGSPVSGTDIVGGLLAGGSSGSADQASDSGSSDGAKTEYNTGPASQESPSPEESGAPKPE